MKQSSWHTKKRKKQNSWHTHKGQKGNGWHTKERKKQSGWHTKKMRKESGWHTQKKKNARTYHSILNTKAQLVLDVWPFDQHLHNRRAGHNCQLDHSLWPWGLKQINRIENQTFSNTSKKSVYKTHISTLVPVFALICLCVSWMHQTCMSVSTQVHMYVCICGGCVFTHCLS